jgi:PHD/YefM family antitoxin component YafN of YafNO toxin-antitoxin module
MNTFREQFIVDENGKTTAVILPIDDYKVILEELELFESIRAYDAAKASGDESIPLEQAIREIELARK